MKNQDPVIQVTAAVIVQNRKVLIARRRPDKSQPNRWEFPGGKIEPGESPRQCLRRELKEEFCIDSTVGEYLGSNFHRYPFGVIELMAFRVSWDGEALFLRDHGAVRWAAPDELADFEFSPADILFAEKIRSGEIPL